MHKVFGFLILLISTMIGCANENRTSNFLIDGSEVNEKDTLNELKGKVLFTIDLKTFYTNRGGRRIASSNDLEKFIPLFFYKQDNEFFIPNRMDNEIVKVKRDGKILSRIQIPAEDIVKFFIDSLENKYIFNKNQGFISFDKKNSKTHNRPRVINITPDVDDGNFLVEQISSDGDSIFIFDKNRLLMNDFSFMSHYYDLYLDGNFIYELDYDSLKDMKDSNDRSSGYFSFNALSLADAKLLKSNKFYLDCVNCFDLPKVLSKHLIIATSYETTSPVNQLFILKNDKLTSHKLHIQKSRNLIDTEYDYFLNNGYSYFYSDNEKKIYGLCTDDQSLTLVEYDLINLFSISD
ncbi:MAG: hypothetical protein KF775_14430 [Cyclobacteriaceae bacterium]|nr:hypothetical protein [Cyclobacteriaceae bacterium]